MYEAMTEDEQPEGVRRPVGRAAEAHVLTARTFTKARAETLAVERLAGGCIQNLPWHVVMRSIIEGGRAQRGASGGR
jgi:hypothetical protein